MNIKSFGCSFIFGSDLSDIADRRQQNQPSVLTWPALVAKKMNLNYQCFARPGSGNLQIMERVINHAHSNPADFFVIGWTWIDRFDYVDADANPWQTLHTEPMPCWQTLLPTSQDKSSKLYYKNLHSQYQDKLTSLIYVKTALDCLLAKKIKFVMTYMDDLLFEPEWTINPAVTYLQDSVRDHMTDFEGKNFLDWSRDHNYPVSEKWHPLEQAHTAAKDVMISKFKKQ